MVDCCRCVALASAALVLVTGGVIQDSGAFFALVFDAAVLVALLVARWPSESIAGT